uniref:hypothetical protein n=1 Tax=Prevotella sp. TaxID=59823 RepID=UPI0040274121
LLKLCHGEKECHVMEQLRLDIASSRPVQTKGCCMETTMNNASPGQIRQRMSKAKRYIFVV